MPPCALTAPIGLHFAIVHIILWKIARLGLVRKAPVAIAEEIGQDMIYKTTSPDANHIFLLFGSGIVSSTSLCIVVGALSSMSNELIIPFVYAGEVLSGAIILPIVGACIVSLRFYMRIQLKQKLGMDDWSIFVAWVSPESGAKTVY